jgi:hypothetical protein
MSWVQVNETTHTTEIISLYRKLIEKAISDCGFELCPAMDLGKLQAKFKVIMKAAHYDGVSEAVIHQMIEESMPKKAPKVA